MNHCIEGQFVFYMSIRLSYIFKKTTIFGSWLKCLQVGLNVLSLYISKSASFSLKNTDTTEDMDTDTGHNNSHKIVTLTWWGTW